jgi:hypothetical protein
MLDIERVDSSERRALEARHRFPYASLFEALVFARTGPNGA